MRVGLRAVAGFSLAVALSACGGDPANGFDAGSGGGNGSGSDAGTLTGLPCDVSAFVGTHCISCHGVPRSGGAPIELATRADFLKVSDLSPPLTNADRSLVRIKSPQGPMPPLPYTQPTAAEVSGFEAWVLAGEPAGKCDGTPDAGTIGPAPTTCTSGSNWNYGNAGSVGMNPGDACRACHLGDNFMGQNPSHVSQSFRAYFFMGTAYPALHELNLCNGAPPAGTIVEIVDHNGAVALRLAVNSPSGNFYSGATTAGIALPYTARIKANGKVVTMSTPQTNGDCNTCHTEQGTSGAPGRIVWPK